MAKSLAFLQSFVIEVESKVMKPVKSLERQIFLNLREADAKTRPADSNGLWCHVLLPIVLLLYSYFNKVSLLYKITSLISVGLLFYCILFLLYLSASSVVLKRPVYAGCIASSVVASALISWTLNLGLVFSLSISYIAAILFAWILRLCIRDFHNTFTIGEAMIVSQSFVLFCVMSLMKFFFVESKDKDMEFISIIVYTVLSTVGLIVTALYVLRESQRNLKTLAVIVGVAAGIVLIVLHSILGLNAMSLILHFIFVPGNRAKIFTFWLILLILAIISLLIRTKLAVKASTVTRKTFHILASLVFLSGIIFDVYLMTLAAGIGLGVLIFVEALRKSNIEPISSALQSAFLVYSDEKDSGVFAMTPLYLYLGLAFPLLVVPDKPDRELELLSGVLSIGVGDTAASWFGSRIGFNKWPGILTAKRALLRVVISATIAGLVEARTAQVDNLVLPLVMMLTFQATWIIC